MDTDNEYRIGQRIRETRKSLGLRQADLSAGTGLPVSHLSDIERAVITPTIPTLHKISQALNRPMEYFFIGQNGEPRSIGMVIHRTPVGGQAAAKFAQLLEDKTGGDIKLRIYHNAAEVTVRDLVEGLVEGAVHLYIDEPLGFECYAPLCGPAFLPYFFSDRDQYHRFLESQLFEKHIYQELLDNGIRLLNPVSNWECGSFEVLYSIEPVFKPSDLAGRKMRSYASEAAIKLRRALCAEPVVVEWESTYEAFEKGTIDTFLVPAAHFYSLNIHKLVDYATLLDYGYTLNMNVAISEREYHKLDPDVQNALSEATEETGEYFTKLTEQQTVIDLEQISDEHEIPVIHPDQGLWRESFTSSIHKICKDDLIDRDLFRELQAL